VSSATAPGIPPRWTEEELKHLEMIQSAIMRMAGNSFNMKAWTVGIASTALALTSKEGAIGALLAAAVGVAFCFLDAYYLRQERLFRRLYNAVRLRKSVDPFDMDTAPYKEDVDGFLRTMCSRTVLGFYGPLLVVIVCIGIYVRHLGH
jgi:hypothetical protein